ncbi:MAG: class I SAM-dependent methyltransferase, partial [Bacteroidales bacterium]|nr:class I SAM-dependent methyltransferase [Bacteroidales bacterium]
MKDKDKMKEMWEARYGEKEFAYGQVPNTYLKEQIAKLARRKILFPAEGEGRNAVYAATQGWEASAFDLSHEGYKKAIALCMKHQVTIDYKIGDLSQLNYEKESFDALALIYAHFPPQLRREYHQLLSTYVKPGGFIILEGYSQNNIALGKKENVTMGPPD